MLTQKLDGTKRNMANEGELAAELAKLGFSTIEAAEYTEEEKAYIFELATVVVLPVGAGMVNLLFAAPHARVIFLCPPSLTAYLGQNMCDWTRDWFVPHFLYHLQMQSTVLRQVRRVANHGSGFNGGWALTSIANTTATIRRCMEGTVEQTNCAAIPTRPTG